MENFIDIAYLLSAILFIYGLKMLSHPKTARNGNLIASLGMLIAIIAPVSLGTNLDMKMIGYPIRMKIQCKASHGENSATMKALVLQEMVKKGIFLPP